MNRHVKAALLLVPFLMIGGFILSDLYMEHQAFERRIFELKPLAGCDISQAKCVLTSGDLQVNIAVQNGVTTLNSSYPLDRATLFLVGTDGLAQEYRLGIKKSPYDWKRQTPLSQIMNNAPRQLLRVIVEIKGGIYIAEFYARVSV